MILAGPNGAGKTTAASRLVRDEYGVVDFVSADGIAAGLSLFAPWSARVAARAVQDDWLYSLAREGRSFAFETTLASLRWESLIIAASSLGATVRLVFLWLPSADLAVERVRQRAASGGHTVPEDAIRGRYTAGICNLINLYKDIVEEWQLYDSSLTVPLPIAIGVRGAETHVLDEARFNKVGAQANGQVSP